MEHFNHAWQFLKAKKQIQHLPVLPHGDEPWIDEFHSEYDDRKDWQEILYNEIQRRKKAANEKIDPKDLTFHSKPISKPTGFVYSLKHPVHGDVATVDTVDTGRMFPYAEKEIGDENKHYIGSAEVEEDFQRQGLYRRLLASILGTLPENASLISSNRNKLSQPFHENFQSNLPVGVKLTDSLKDEDGPKSQQMISYTRDDSKVPSNWGSLRPMIEGAIWGPPKIESSDRKNQAEKISDELERHKGKNRQTIFDIKTGDARAFKPITLNLGPIGVDSGVDVYDSETGVQWVDNDADVRARKKESMPWSEVAGSEPWLDRSPSTLSINDDWMLRRNDGFWKPSPIPAPLPPVGKPIGPRLDWATGQPVQDLKEFDI